MKRGIDLVVANPAGNTTIIVTSPVDRSDYADVANKLLEIDFGEYCDWADSVKGEQVAYALACAEENPAMDMCGLEFCGNASRSFAYYRVATFGDGRKLDDGKSEITVDVSGCKYPLTAVVDVNEGDSSIQMPLPVNITMVSGAPFGAEGEYPLIDLDGISHLVLTGIEASPERFDMIKEYIYSEISPEMEAFGTMFIDEETGIMSPVVYVRDVDTTYFEGSCASGTTAASVAKAAGAPDGIHRFTFVQPAGTLYTTVTKNDGQITDIKLGGLIEMSGPVHVEI